MQRGHAEPGGAEGAGEAAAGPGSGRRDEAGAHGGMLRGNAALRQGGHGDDGPAMMDRAETQSVEGEGEERDVGGVGVVGEEGAVGDAVCVGVLGLEGGVGVIGVVGDKVCVGIVGEEEGVGVIGVVGDEVCVGEEGGVEDLGDEVCVGHVVDERGVGVVGVETGVGDDVCMENEGGDGDERDEVCMGDEVDVGEEGGMRDEEAVGYGCEMDKVGEVCMRSEVCMEDARGMAGDAGEVGAMGEEVGVDTVGRVEDEVDEGMRWTKGTWWKRWNPFVETVGDCDPAAVVTALVSGAPACDAATERPGRLTLAGLPPHDLVGPAKASAADPLRECFGDAGGNPGDPRAEGDPAVSPSSEAAPGPAGSAPVAGKAAGSPRSELVVRSPLYPLDLLKRLNDDRLGEASLCDVTVAVQDARFPAHRAVLAVASSYLGALLRHQHGRAVVRLGEAGTGGECSVTSPAFARLIEFVYTAELRLPPSDVAAVLGAARALRVEEAVRVLTARDAEPAPLGERRSGPATLEPGAALGWDAGGESGGSGPLAAPSGAPGYHCPACLKRFTYKKSFENHVLRQHPAERAEQGAGVPPDVTAPDKAGTAVAQTRRSQRTPCPTSKRKLSVAGVAEATEETASRQPASSVSSPCPDSAGRSSQRSGAQADRGRSAAAVLRKRPCRAGAADRVIAPSGQYEEDCATATAATATGTGDTVKSGFHDNIKNNIMRHEGEAVAVTMAPGVAYMKPGDGTHEEKRAAAVEDEKAALAEEEDGGSNSGGTGSDSARRAVSAASKARARLAERRIPPVLAPLLPPGGKRLFECPRCHKAFDRKGKYACHMRIHTGEKPFSCKTCDQRFTSKSNLTAHAKRHGRRLASRPARGPRLPRRPRGDGPASACGPSLPPPVGDDDHDEEEVAMEMDSDADAREGPSQLQCQVCDKWFQRRAHLEEHGILHTVATPFPCGFCTESFRSRFARLKHQEKTHLGPFPCNVCGRAFNDSGNLKRHVDCTHGGKKKWTCNVCGKAVRERTTLKEHMRIHSGEKPHLCSVCGQRFRHSSTYRLHVRVHQEDRRYECESCGKTFNRQDHLSKHRKTHSGERTHMCEECGKCFGRRDHLNIHYKSVHLGEKIWQKYKPSLHECEVCKKVFKGKSSLDIHYRTHSGERPFECSICAQGFRVKKSLAKHMVTHSEERPYPCPHCSASFKRKDKLKYHLDHVHWPKGEPAPSLDPSDEGDRPGGCGEEEPPPPEAVFVHAPGGKAEGGELRVALAVVAAAPVPGRACGAGPPPRAAPPPAAPPAEAAAPLRLPVILARPAPSPVAPARRRPWVPAVVGDAGPAAAPLELALPSLQQGPAALDSALEAEPLPSELEFLEKYGLAPQPASLLHPVSAAELGGPASRDHAYLGALLSLEDVRGPGPEGPTMQD